MIEDSHAATDPPLREVVTVTATERTRTSADPRNDAGGMARLGDKVAELDRKVARLQSAGEGTRQEVDRLAVRADKFEAERDRSPFVAELGENTTAKELMAAYEELQVKMLLNTRCRHNWFRKCS